MFKVEQSNSGEFVICFNGYLINVP